MKTVVFTLAVLLLLNNCNGKEKSQKSVITENDVCALLDTKSLENIVGEKLIASPGERKFDYARTCSYTNKHGYPYVVLTLFLNERGKDVTYFAPPDSVFNSEMKALPKAPNRAIAVVGKEEKNTIELLAQSGKRVVSFTFMKVEVKDGSKHQKQLIQTLQDVANKAKELK